MRRPQFRLKSLLGVAIAVCLILGASHLYTSYRQFVAVEPAQLGREIQGRGRYFFYDGPTIQTFFALADLPGEEEFKDRDCCEGGAIARRVGAGTYDFQFRLSRPHAPGVHRLRIWPHVQGELGEPLETTFTVTP